MVRPTQIVGIVLHDELFFLKCFSKKGDELTKPPLGPCGHKPDI